MGNLEKAGVLVVVALLAVILVVAFLNFPDQNGKTPVLGASAGKIAQADMRAGGLRPEPMNIRPSAPPVDVIRPKLDNDRSSSDAPPRVILEPEAAKVAPPPPEMIEDDAKDRNPPPPPVKPVPEKPAPVASGYPKSVKVQPGESLWAIAVREYGPKTGPKMVGLIADANPKVRPEALKAGTEISLPAPPAGEVTEAKPRIEPEKKPTPPASGTAKAPATTTAPKRKLPFVPN